MAKRVVFEVRYVRDDSDEGIGLGWAIFQDGVLRTTDGHAYHDGKEAAVRTAVYAMKLEERSELKVKGKNGRIQERRTWPRSSDPKGRG